MIFLLRVQRVVGGRKASFILHGSSRLTLLEAVRSQPPDAEFASLSHCDLGCDTAEITEENIADEELHFTAASLKCSIADSEYERMLGQSHPPYIRNLHVDFLRTRSGARRSTMQGSS